MPNLANLSTATGLAQVRFEKHLADASVGCLWLGRYLNGSDAGRTVVLRRIAKQWLSHADAEWVRQGAAAYANVRHPSLTKLLGVVENGDDLISISEHIEGVRLAALMRTVFADGVPIPATVVVRLVLDAARATWTAHRLAADAGLQPTLRLFLPEGVLVASYGGTLLTEIGLLAALARCVVPRTVPDLLAQLAPEELGAKTAHSGSPEVFSLGVVLWELLANRWLFSRESDSRTHQDMLLSKIPSLHQTERYGLPIPEVIVNLVTKATDRDPSQRFGSVHDLVLAIEQLPAHFVASEHQVAEVLRQRTPVLLKESKSEEAERTISGTFAEIPTCSASVIPPSGSDDNWDRPTFAQRSLISGLPGDISVARISSSYNIPASAPHSIEIEDDYPKPQRRSLGLWPMSVLLILVGVSAWAYRKAPITERFFSSPVPAGAVSPKPSGLSPASTPTVTSVTTPNKSQPSRSASPSRVVKAETESPRPEAQQAQPDRAIADAGLPTPASSAALPPTSPASSAKAIPAVPVKQAAPIWRVPARKSKPARSSSPTAEQDSTNPALDPQWGI